MTNRFVIIVPARAASTRLPNKPMISINGRSLISRIIDLAHSSNAINTYIATDNIEIKNHVESLGANVVMTSEEHASGTDRIAEAAKKIDLPMNTPILNLQGDEPFMPLQIINKLPMLVSKDAPISTACIGFNEKMDIKNPNEVKVVRSKSKKAIYFSRSVIPNSFSFDYKNYDILKDNELIDNFTLNTWHIPDEIINLIDDKRFRLVIPFNDGINERGISW